MTLALSVKAAALEASVSASHLRREMAAGRLPLGHSKPSMTSDTYTHLENASGKAARLMDG